MTTRPDFLRETLHPQGQTSQINNVKRDVEALKRNPTPIPAAPPAYSALLRLGIRQIQAANLSSFQAITTAMDPIAGLSITLQSAGGLCLVLWHGSIEITNGILAGPVIVDTNVVVDGAVTAAQRLQLYTDAGGVVTATVGGSFLVPITGSNLHTFIIEADRIQGASANMLADTGLHASGITVIELDTDPGMLYIANQTPPSPRS